jgi:RES domain
VIVYRQTDVDVPFFWESDRQPAQRWHDAGEGPVQYASSTPDAAWSEFLRHAGIDDPADLDGVNRVMWAIEIPGSEVEEEAAMPALPTAVMTGGIEHYHECRAEARRLRVNGATRLVAPAAAVLPGTPSGWRVDDGLVPAPAREEFTIVVFGRPVDAVAWIAALGRPGADIIPRVRYLR